jgi:capsule polysaccharide export protein KpsE/RkpR
LDETRTPTETRIEPRSKQREILLEVESAAAIDWGVEKLRLVWNRRRFVWKSILVGLLIGTALAFLLPPEYESYTRLMPPDDQSNRGLAMITALAGKSGGGGGGGGGGAGIAGMAGDLLGVKTTGAMFVGILASRTVQDDLIGKFNLQKVYREKRLEQARLDLTKHTTVVEDHKSGIITITVTDRSAQRAREMANEYVSELNRVVTQLSTSAAHREREFLENRLVTVKQDLENAEKQFSQFSSKSGALDIKEQGKAMVEAAAILQGQMMAAQSELEGLRQLYSDSNVRVRGAQARIAELQRQLEKLGGRPQNEVVAGSSEDSSIFPSIRRLPLLGVTYADLFREAKVQEIVFETLTQQFELAKVQEAKEIPSVKVLDPGSIPESRSFPPRLLLMALGAFLGCCVGISWLFTTAMWTRMDPLDPRKLLAEEVFGTVAERTRTMSNNNSGAQFKFLSRVRTDHDQSRDEP